MSCAAVSRSGREETPLPCVQTAGQGWFQCLEELGRCWSVLERAEEGGRWSEPSPEQSHSAHHPHLAVRYCKKSGCSSLNFSADASGPKYFCGLQQGKEKGRTVSWESWSSLGFIPVGTDMG